MNAVIGPVRPKVFEEINKPIIRDTEEILESGRRIMHLHKFDDEVGRNLIRSVHYPLRGDRDHAPAVLMILDDITELMEEREHKERVFRQLVNTLVDLVGQRDPFSANHATRVADVAINIAKEMGLKTEEIDTVDIAAQLMNLGKTLVPVEVLTKPGALTEEELDLVRNSILTSAKLLEGIEFDVPVAETVRQVQEQWDGSGRPSGLSGEDILISARVVAVANSFTAMISRRTHRKDPATFDEAENILM